MFVMARRTFIVVLSAVTVASAANTFVTLGDWGGSALDNPQYAINTQTVAAAMATTVENSAAQFIVNTGDSFYWCGIQNTSDYQIAVDFEDPYSASALSSLKWYGVLGNHEYGYNVSAVLDYASVNPIWVMDDRYYTRRLEIGDTGSYMSFVFIDTNPCISDYRSDNDANWDPCGSEFPTCSLSDDDDDFEGPCEFHANIVAQDCTTQYEWFQAALAAVPEDDWLIVVGHAPIDEVDVEDFTSVLQDHGFDLYLNGHVHTLTQYTIDNAGAYVTSGAGAMVDTPDQTSTERMRAKKRGEDWSGPAHGRGSAAGSGLKGSSGGPPPPPPDDDHKPSDDNGGSDDGGSSSSHSYQSVWNEVVAGFTLHTFSDDLSTLTTDFIDYSGEVLHSFTVEKGAGYTLKNDKVKQPKATS